MGVVTAGLIVSAGLSAYQIASSEKKINDKERDIANFERQELRNPNRDIQIGTLKSEQQTRANLVNVATSVEALQRTGTRGVLGGIPKVNQSSILLQEQISRDLERQEVERSIRIARGEENIRAIREQRETGALAGLHNQLDQARHEQASAVGSLIQTGLGFAESQLGNTTQPQQRGIAKAIGTLDRAEIIPFNLQPTQKLDLRGVNNNILY